MNKKIYLNNLYDYYSSLSTEKQRKYYESYYFQDLSLAEIAENHQVSRNAIHNQIKIVEEKLEFYEKTLKLYQKAIEIKKLIQNMDNQTKKKIEELL